MSLSGGDYETDNDNQKLFSIYETYLNKADVSDTESEPDISLNDEFFEIFDKKVSKTPTTNRTVHRISCLADIESRTPRLPPRIGPTDLLNISDEEPTVEPTLPWNLSEMSEQQVFDLINNLDQEISLKENQYPQLSAEHMKVIYDKQIQLFNQNLEDSENHFQDCLQKINNKQTEVRVAFDELIGQQLAEIKLNSEMFAKHCCDLSVIRQLLSQ